MRCMKKTSNRDTSSNNRNKSYYLPKIKNLNFNDELSCLPKTTKKTKKTSTKTFLPNINVEDHSSSWNQQHSGNSTTSLKNVEEISTQKVVEQWKIVEDILYNKKEHVHLNQALLEECFQWQKQLPHLIIIGNSCRKDREKEDGKKEVKEELDKSDDENELEIALGIENLERRRSSQFSIIELTKLTAQNRRQIREYVFDYLLEYVCSELMYYQQEITESSEYDFKEHLKLNSPDEMINNVHLVDDRSMRDNNCEKQLSTDDLKSSEEIITNEERETNVSDTARFKPGTVFVEKIIVSPVPCPISTRESFTTLKINSMQLVKRQVEFSLNQGYLSRNSYNPSSSLPSTTVITKPHSGWRVSGCYTPSAENVKLAPIELSTLPNNKKWR